MRNLKLVLPVRIVHTNSRSEIDPSLTRLARRVMNKRFVGNRFPTCSQMVDQFLDVFRNIPDCRASVRRSSETLSNQSPWKQLAGCKNTEFLPSFRAPQNTAARYRIMSKQYIFQMVNMTKKFNGKAILEDIWLSFYPGAKIGVLGRNGSGKSTLLKIMAGIDKEYDGEARLTDGFTCLLYTSPSPRDRG